MGKLSQLLKRIKKSKQIIRMTLVGDSAVGKTSIIQALKQKTANYKNKSIADNILKNKEPIRTTFMEIETWAHKDLVFQCYDLAGKRIPGSHPLDLMRNQVIKFIDIYIFVFSVDVYKSLENINNWIELMDLKSSNINGNSGLVLVGNKIDLERKISTELFKSIVGKDKFFQKYVETCSLDGKGIGNLLDEITNLGYKLLNN